VSYKETLSLSREELIRKLKDLREERFRLNLQHTSHQLESTALLVKVRKDIARVKTALRQKEMEESGNQRQ